MARTATTADMKKPLGEVFSDLEAAGDSLVIRENGNAIATLLTGSEYEHYRELLRAGAWASVEDVGQQNAALSAEEISAEVDRMVDRVRSESRASRAAS